VILGARNSRQLAENLKAASLDLTAEEIARLSSVSAPAISEYPYGKGGTAQRHRRIAGVR
jgi:aryl-alcohol dehydrogenase-like predicted oxidoreductase